MCCDICVFWFLLGSQQARLQVWFPVSGEGMSLVSEWITRFLRDRETAPAFKDASLRSAMVAGNGLGLFRFSFVPLCRCGEEGRGCGRSFKKCMHLLLYFCYYHESQKFYITLAIKAKVCESQISFSWHRDFAASELSRSIAVSPCRGW